INPTIGGRTEGSAHHQSPPKERSTGTSTLRGFRRVGGTDSGTDGGRGRPPSDRKFLERGVGHSLALQQAQENEGLTTEEPLGSTLRGFRRVGGTDSGTDGGR